MRAFKLWLLLMTLVLTLVYLSAGIHGVARAAGEFTAYAIVFVGLCLAVGLAVSLLSPRTSRR